VLHFENHPIKFQHYYTYYTHLGMGSIMDIQNVTLIFYVVYRNFTIHCECSLNKKLAINWISICSEFVHQPREVTTIYWWSFRNNGLCVTYCVTTNVHYAIMQKIKLLKFRRVTIYTNLDAQVCWSQKYFI